MNSSQVVDNIWERVVLPQKNHAVASDIFDALRDGLEDYVLSQYRKSYNDTDYLAKLADFVWDNDHLRRPLSSDDEAKQKIDPAGWLNAIWRNKPVFRNDMGNTYKGGDHDKRNGINIVGEMLNARNRWAHKKKRDHFSDEDVYRLSDTASRLLRAVGASEQIATTNEIKVEFGQKIYGSIRTQTEPATEESDPSPVDDVLKETASESYASTTMAIIRNPANWHVLTGCIILCVLLIIGILSFPQRSPHVNLSGANLRGMDLTGRNMRYADLAGADLVESILRNENLSAANLEGAKLHKADLSNVTLTDANLLTADLSNAILANAVLPRANLSDALLKQAIMEYADLTDARLSNADMDAADLRNAKLENAVLTGANLVGTDFRGANLQGADLEGAVLFLQVRDFFRRDPSEAVFDETTVIPDGSFWSADTDMTKFTGLPEEG